MFEQLHDSYARWRLYRHTLQVLKHLGPTTLRDIGLDQPTPRDLRHLARTATRERVQ